MEIEDVDAASAQFGKGFGEGRLQLIWRMVAGLDRVAFCGKGEAAVLPVRFSGESFLGASDVAAGCVEFIVA